MHIKQVMARTGLTRKAIQYYEQQGLLTPSTDDNGYRVYDSGAIQTLERIAFLRSLSCGVMEIHTILHRPEQTQVILQAHLQTLKAQKHELQARLDVLEDVVHRLPQEGMQVLQSKISLHHTHVEDALRRAFPGPFGDFLSVHFHPFLSVSLSDQTQIDALDRLIAFLDDCVIDVPKELQISYTQEELHSLQEGFWQQAQAICALTTDEERRTFLQGAMQTASSVKQTIIEHAPAIYDNLQAAQKMLKDALTQAGYYEHVTQNMRLISPAYAEYLDALQALQDVMASMPNK